MRWRWSPQRRRRPAGPRSLTISGRSAAPVAGPRSWGARASGHRSLRSAGSRSMTLAGNRGRGADDLDRLNSSDQTLWCASQAIEAGCTRDILVLLIDLKLHERKGRAITNFAATVPPRTRTWPSRPPSDLLYGTDGVDGAALLAAASRRPARWPSPAGHRAVPGRVGSRRDGGPGRGRRGADPLAAAGSAVGAGGVGDQRDQFQLRVLRDELVHRRGGSGRAVARL